MSMWVWSQCQQQYLTQISCQSYSGFEVVCHLHLIWLPFRRRCLGMKSRLRPQGRQALDSSSMFETTFFLVYYYFMAVACHLFFTHLCYCYSCSRHFLILILNVSDTSLLLLSRASPDRYLQRWHFQVFFSSVHALNSEKLHLGISPRSISGPANIFQEGPPRACVCFMVHMELQPHSSATTDINKQMQADGAAVLQKHLSEGSEPALQNRLWHLFPRVCSRDSFPHGLFSS